MTLTLKIKLLPTKAQEQLLRHACREYISLVNDVVDYAVGQGFMPKLTTAGIVANLPSAVKNQALQDAKSVYRKGRKLRVTPVLRKPVCLWNNQNYKVNGACFSFPVFVDGRSQRITISSCITEQQCMILEDSKLGALRITACNGKWVAQVAYEVADATSTAGSDTMGVDLGLKCPAVVSTGAGHVRFFGNGRQIKQKRRHFQTHRKKLGKAKKVSALRKSSNKEQRWMRDQDHKLSRQIVDYAAASGCSTIKMEKLSNIRRTARTSRKNNRSLHNWSFYRLATYIEYKANLLGIEVAYIDPAYTSQRCPACGTLNKAKDRNYKCSCGLKMHRDIVGARNILCA